MSSLQPTWDSTLRNTHKLKVSKMQNDKILSSLISSSDNMKQGHAVAWEVPALVTSIY